MTGQWEQRLQNFAEGGVPWDVPTRTELSSGLSVLKDVLSRVASDPGVAGEAGDAATKSFSEAARQIANQIDWINGHLDSRLNEANDVRSRARDSLGSLPAGQMTGGQEALVRGAAIGATLMLGPVSFLAGEGATQAVNTYLAGQREEAARQAMERHSDEMDAVQVGNPPPFTAAGDEGRSSEDETGGSSFDSGSGGRSGARSFERYPDWNMPAGGGGGSSIGDGGTGNGTGEPPTGTGPGDYGPFPTPTPIKGMPAPIDLGSVAHDPTADGPVTGSPTLPGGVPAMPGGGLVGGTPGGPGAGIGSGLGAGLVAGGGGALALGRLGGSGAGAGGSLFSGGSAGAGGAAKAGGSAGSGGLLGKPAGGSGLGARGVGGLAAGGGTAPGSSAARGAGMRGTSGLGGAGGAGGTGASGGSVGGGTRGTAGSGGAAAAGGRGAPGGTRGVGGMGGPGSRSERKRDGARGLGGPIAPRLEDDDEIAPRSENAQAGGRDE
ncbi:hypothetical protein AB1K56_16615 [Microbacterium sp. BWR-S6Y]|uniref:hypothetical protein n=1 Tax=Microbacterium sp. BWR-S6Y TaxID=3232073 RepID=UPI003528F60F